MQAGELQRLKEMGVRFGQLPGRPIEAVGFQGTRVTDNDLRILADLSDVLRVDLSDTAITDNGLRYLGHLRQLNGLRLNNTKVTDNGLALIEGSSELELLHLMNTSVALRDVRLDSLPSLRILDATGSPVDDLSMITISRAPKLTSLGLRRTRITDRGLSELKRLTTLQVLDLSGTSVSDGCCATLRHINPPALRALVLMDCTFSTSGLRELAELRITHLNLSGGKLPFPDAIVLLGKCPALNELIIDRTAVSDDDLKALADGFSQLTLFQACKTSLSDTCFEKIGKLPHLKMLILNDTDVTSEAVDRFRVTHPQIDVRHDKLRDGQGTNPRR
jgi:hypothetical protein